MLEKNSLNYIVKMQENLLNLIKKKILFQKVCLSQ